VDLPAPSPPSMEKNMGCGVSGLLRWQLAPPVPLLSIAKISDRVLQAVL
jgi:hypothetical protein